MQAKCWPYLRYRANSQCTRVCHTTLPPYHAASRSGSVLSICSHPHQPRDTNQHDWNFPFVTDRIDRMCSVRILSADTTQRPWALLFLMGACCSFTHVLQELITRYAATGPDNTISNMASDSGIIVGMGSTSERWCYIVASSSIGWAHTQNDLCDWLVASFENDGPLVLIFNREIG